MTKERILNMVAGEQMDALIETVIFDRTLTREASDASYVKTPNGYEDLRRNKKYSTDISAAWEIVDMFTNGKHKEPTHFGMMTTNRGFGVDIGSGYANSETASEAICKAALLAEMNL